MRKRTNFRKSSKPKKTRTTPYNIPDDSEIQKKKDELNKHLKKLDESGHQLKPMTQSQEMSLIRSAIREKWMYSDVKLAYLYMGVEPDFDPDTRRKFKVQCECCGQWFTVGEICIDHKVGEHSLKSIEDFQEFKNSILDVGFDDLQRLCDNCHMLKTAQERYNLTEEEAVVFKKVTAWEKDNPKADQQKKFLRKAGFSAAEVANVEARRKSALEYFKTH